ncbi:MAG: sensor histidine kinase [Dehalococcoidia bacterium]|jgi:two-component system sensor histidine kinase DegS|nr:sensor histidine kinase [Dehalococcoidia bacterium]
MNVPTNGLPSRLALALRVSGSVSKWLPAVGLFVAISILYYVLIDLKDDALWLFHFEIRNYLHGCLYLIPFVCSMRSPTLSTVLASFGVTFGAALPRIIYYSLGARQAAINVLFFMVPFFIVTSILLEMRWRRQQIDYANERVRQRDIYLGRVFSAQERERRRIAQGLHDDILQRLTFVALEADRMAVATQKERAESANHAAIVRDETARLVEDVRRLSYDLRPSILDSLGLIPSLRWLAQRLEKEAGIRVSLRTTGNAYRLRTDAEVKLFRIVQEALNNARQHAEATRVKIKLDYLPGHLTILVSDNGRGFEAAGALRRASEEGHLGLIGMKERVESMNGDLGIESRLQKGTIIRVVVPAALGIDDTLDD